MLTTAMLKHLIDGIERFGGTADVVVCGSDLMADRAREILAELGRDFHVIVDDELSPQRLWVTTLADLAKFPGGGQN